LVAAGPLSRPLAARSEHSKILNEMRLKVLTAREAAIQEVISEAKAKLKEVSKNPALYKKLLTDLIMQVGSSRRTAAIPHRPARPTP
jgi:vacuolar-type H+-ATPase subunit E/Vma4